MAQNSGSWMSGCHFFSSASFQAYRRSLMMSLTVVRGSCVAMHASSDKYHHRHVDVSGPWGNDEGLKKQSPAAPDRLVRRTEDAVDQYSDHEDHEHQGQHLLCVRQITSELQLLAQGRLMRDDHDQLARHQAAPRERPALLQSTDKSRQGCRENYMPIQAKPTRTHGTAHPDELRLHMVDSAQ